MADLNFPNSPVDGQEYEGYIYDAVVGAWIYIAPSVAANNETLRLTAAFNKANAALQNTTGTFSGTLSVTEKIIALPVGGDEGGEIFLGKPPNANLDGGMTIDAYQNKLRIFEQGGSARGVYIDLTLASPGVGTDLLASAGSVDSLARSTAIAAFDKANAANVLAVTANVLAVSAFNKANSTTYTSNVVISVADNTNAALRITQTGTADVIRVEDSANPDSTPFVVDANGNVGIGVTIPTQGLTLRNTFAFAWDNGSGTADIFLTRRGAANLRLGASDAAAPVAQTLSVQSVVAGTTDTAGANLTITGSQSTGTGVGGSIIFQVAPAGTTGSTQNALATALTLAPSASGGGRITHDVGTLADTTSAYLLSVTTPSSFASLFVLDYQINTLAGSNSSFSGMRLSLNAGYTGSGTVSGATFLNNISGTNTQWFPSSTTTAYRPGGNRGVLGQCGSVAGHSGITTGVIGAASNSTNYNFGVWGSANFAVNNAWNVGVAGFGLNTGTGTQQIGGFFALFSTSGAPNLISAALVADNGSTSSPVFLARVNNSTVWQVTSIGDAAWGSSADAIISRRGAANLRLGAADAAAPVAQTLSVQSVVAGTTNAAGANLTITGSQGTGTGVGGDIIFQTALAGSSGSAQNSLITGLRIYSNQTVAVGKAYTVATLPAAGTQGRRAWVTDATSPTFLGTLTGGGAVVTPVFDNGTAWVAG